MAYPVKPVVKPSILNGQTNGKLPSSILVVVAGLGGGPSLRFVAPAARSYEAMRAAALADGIVLQSVGSYRSYERQESLFRERYTTTVLSGRPSKVWLGKRWYLRAGMATAAVPGTSNHGLGLAEDVADASGARLAWLLKYAPIFGWSWEIQSEPWHIRYVAGDNIPAAVIKFEEEQMQAFTDYVKAEQEALRVAGFDPGPVDGIWGPRSQAARLAALQATGKGAKGDPGPKGDKGDPGAPGVTPVEVTIAGPIVATVTAFKSAVPVVG